MQSFGCRTTVMAVTLDLLNSMHKRDQNNSVEAKAGHANAMEWTQQQGKLHGLPYLQGHRVALRSI